LAGATANAEGIMSMKQQTGNHRKKTIVAVIVVLALVVWLWPWHAPHKTVPDSLLGEWHTSEEAHADRYFEISPVSISFTTGDGTGYTGFIKEITHVQEGSRILYTIVYDVGGTRNELSFYYETGTRSGTFIRFKNQQAIVWTKQENS
jgi:hypothetical protein